MGNCRSMLKIREPENCARCVVFSQSSHVEVSQGSKTARSGTTTSARSAMCGLQAVGLRELREVAQMDCKEVASFGRFQLCHGTWKLAHDPCVSYVCDLFLTSTGTTRRSLPQLNLLNSSSVGRHFFQHHVGTCGGVFLCASLSLAWSL